MPIDESAAALAAPEVDGVPDDPGAAAPAPIEHRWGEHAAALTPAQQEVVDLLGAARDERPTFDAALRLELRAELESCLEPLVDRLPDKGLFVSKHALAGVHGCEGRHVAEQAEGFAWSVPVARGIVAHKAIELAVGWRGEPVPGELVDEAVARLANGIDGIADWLQTASEADLAELRALAAERVTSFLETFPPLRPRWRPVTESRVRVELHDAAVILSGKIDLTLGRADGTTAGKVLVDLKTGGYRPSHVDDLRFYALLETIKLGTPPRLLATYYLDQGRPMVEQVTVDVLAAALRRTVEGAARMVALDEGATPTLRPSAGCSWCPALATCETGRAHLAEDGDRDR
jgi:hypothetical protein